MQIKYFYITLIIFLAHTSSASTMSYLEALSKSLGTDMAEEHQRILEISNKLSFLDCPIELIERQWNGIESVVSGINYFQEFLRESAQIQPDYKTIYEKCLKEVIGYREGDREGLVEARFISQKEQNSLMDKISNQSIPPDPDLLETIANKLNQNTVCFTKHVAFQVAVLVGGSIGTYQMECFTPLGRRFRLKGPSLGIGIGAGASLSLPKGKLFNNRLAYRFSLYKRSEKDPWYVSHMATTYAMGAGVAIEAQPYGGDVASLLGPEPRNPSLGVSMYVEDLYNFMRLKSQSPFYVSLVTANLLDDMAAVEYRRRHIEQHHQ